MRKIICSFLVLALLLTSFAMPTAANDHVAVPILLYHNIADFIPGVAYDASLNTPAFTFERHMRAVLDAGYTPITYEMYYQHVTNGETLPSNPILITFDDGYLSNYLYAYPILKKLGIHATIFVITDRRGKALSSNPHFSWNQAKEMVDSGLIDIQSHTHSHQVSTSLTQQQLAYELVISKRLVELYTGKKCNVLAFPNGIAGERELLAAHAAGYKIINLVGGYGANRKSDGLSALRRLTVFGTWTPQDLIRVLDENKNL